MSNDPKTTPPALTITFWQFRSRLLEWVELPMIYRYQSEIFGLYAVGQSVEKVAGYVAEREAQLRGAWNLLDPLP